MSLQTKLQKISQALVTALTTTEDNETTIVCPVYHYWRSRLAAPFVVWAEDGEGGSFDADDRKKEQVVTGFVDFFTRTEFDPIADTIQDALYGLQSEPFTWRLDSVQYEDETNLIHYQWTWEAV